MKIVIAEKISPAAIDVFKKEPRWTVLTPEQLDGKLAAHLEDADALIVRSAVTVNAPLLENAAHLRVIGRAGVGVDNIDLDAATRKGVAVMNTPGANAVAVAEHTIALMLALARHLCRANELMRAGRWEKKSLQGSELRGKTLGIIGLGRIGMEVARRVRGFGMTVVAHDPFISPAIAREQEIRMAGLDEIYAESDYLTLHVGLTPQTTGMINADSLAKMKRGVRLVNCARGELIQDVALADALKRGHVAAAALDVFSEEPPPKNSPLLALENVITTPHIAGSTHEAQEAVGYQIALQVKEYLKHGVIQNAVNVPSLSHDEYVELHPYIDLAERLGSFLGQSSDGSIEEIFLSYSGRIAEWKTELVRNGAIMGILNQVLADKANLVNAASIASSRGVAVHEERKPKGGGAAANVLSIVLKTSREERLVRGGVLHGNSPRLLSIDGIDIEAPLERNLIYLRNRDVPGVIGRVGTILGDHKINIADFSLGRRQPAAKAASAGAEKKTSVKQAGEAIAVVHIDTRVPEEVLAKLRKIPAMQSAKAIRL